MSRRKNLSVAKSVAAVWLLLFLGSVAHGGERYVLEVPGSPELRSEAVLTEQGTDGSAGIQWRRSRMQVGRQPPPAPVAPHSARHVDPAHPPVAQPRHLGILALGDGNFVVAQIDQEAVLHFYIGGQDHWQHRPTRLREPLLAGAPLVLAADPDSEQPLAYSVNGRGELVEIAEGRRLRTLTAAQGPVFAPGTHLAIRAHGARRHVLAVDDRGRIWQIDLDRPEQQLVESRTGIFEPGVPLAVSGVADEQLFLVDRAGNLLSYIDEAGRWSRPYRVGSGFVSGGALSAELLVSDAGLAPNIHLAAVDRAGQLKLLREAGPTWVPVNTGLRLPPGAPVAIMRFAGLWHLSAVRADGHWLHWYFEDGQWNPRLVANGFPVGAPVLLHRAGPGGFAVDRTGRGIAGHLTAADHWQAVVLSPAFPVGPRVVTREVITAAPLAPTTVEFENRHEEDLLVRILDVRDPERTVELKIPAGRSAVQRIDRDPGAVMEEVFLVVGPQGQFIEEVRRYRLPPSSLYEVAVYADRVTSVYFDRTRNRGPVPDEVQSSLVSIGVFPLPPGDRLQEGNRVDVYQEALARRNPGAVRLLD